MKRLHVRFLSERRDSLRALARRSHEMLLLAGVVGVLTGVGVAAFDSAVVAGVDAVNAAPLWVAAVAPVVGLSAAAVSLRIFGGQTTPATSDEYIRAFHEPSRRLQLRPLVRRTVAGIATLGSGAPMGLEGPSLYLGASIGDILQRRFPRVFTVQHSHTLLVAGAAAGVAAIFKAPATGAVFALEVPYQEDFGRHMLGPALVASACGYLSFVVFHGTESLIPVSGTPPFDFRDLAGAAILGLVAGVGARIFAAMLRYAKHLPNRLSVYVRVPVAGACLAAIFVAARALTGESLTVGPGYDTIGWALDPENSVWIVGAILLLRCIGTSVTVGGGGVGGLFIPLVVAGALTGRIVGGAVNALDTSLFTVIGIAAFLGAGYRVPLAAVVFVAEVTGRPGFVVPGVIAAVVAELLMGRKSVTEYQRRPDDGEAALATPDQA